jgi:DNA polymerase V
VGYDQESLENARNYSNQEIVVDFYGREMPKPAHGTVKLGCHTALPSKIVDLVLLMYDKIVEPSFLIRRVNISANNVFFSNYEEIGLFDDFEQIKKEESLQSTMLNIKNRYGKNALLKGTNLQEGATMKERNCQIGGHKA